MLTTGFWPTYKSDDLNLPSEMTQCIDTFKAFYDGRTSHRRLRWVHSLGSATVLGQFTPGGKTKKHDLMVSTYQACILLIFNEQDTHSFSDMQQSLNLPPEELKRYALFDTVSRGGTQRADGWYQDNVEPAVTCARKERIGQLARVESSCATLTVCVRGIRIV